MADQGRHADLKVLYRSVDITADLQPFLLSWSWTEGLEKADDLQISVQDSDGRWLRSWLPEKGDAIRAEIIVSETGSVRRLPCGLFAVDGWEHGGPPDTMTIKATSADVTTSIRREKKSRSWEKVSLKQVAGKIAATGKMKLLWQASTNPTYKKLSQSNQSDLAFLVKVCEREGLRVKVSDGQLVVFPQEQYDAQAGVMTIRKGVDAVLSHNLKRDSVDAYRAAVVRYRDEKKKKVLEYKYALSGASADGQVLRIRERCESLAEAQRVCKARLNVANRGLVTGDITVVGDTRLASGVNVNLSGWGRMDGKYAIEETTHGGPAYTTGLKLRQVSG